jgi:tetratricopeptide (TPR) repeat protein
MKSDSHYVEVMDALIEHVRADVICRTLGDFPFEFRIRGDDALKALVEWAGRYDAAVRRNQDGELLAIGREFFGWLNESGWASKWTKAIGPRSLEIRVDDLDEPLTRAMLDAPWELLAGKDGYLADDRVQLFEVARRIGSKGEPIAPQHSDLQLMFMAAAPEGESQLDFEAEEAAILNATQGLPLHLVVEESGAAKFLGDRLDLDGPFDVLHISCHGDIHPKRGHVLALEDEVGDLAYADAGQIVELLGDPERTPLVFLSACRTAEQAESAPGIVLPFEPFVRDLARAGVANVLGWDGSVYYADALAFAQVFYRELTGRERIPRAAAVARQALRVAGMEDPQCGRHWHLARLYLGPKGGSAVAASGQPKRKLAGAAYEKQFLDEVRSEVPVAKRSEFVGRRRKIQAVLQAFRNGATGVLIYGMANLGKSSLAARIASRMSGHKTVVVFREYDALTIFDRILDAIPAQQRKDIKRTWRDGVIANTETLSEALEALLEGPLDEQPILLIVDDLESILEKPRQSDAPTPVQARYQATIGALLSAFAKAQTTSRFLITSRYLFTLPDGRGRDLAARLARVPLQPMEEGDQVKQLRAAARLAELKDLAAIDQALALRALEVAGGNSGLQAALTMPILKGEGATAKRAIGAIEHFQKTGAPPEEIRKLIEEGAGEDNANVVVAFFKRMAFDTYRAALTDAQATMLRAACVFSVGLPIPRPALEAVGSAAGIEDSKAALERLLGLGLADDWGSLGQTAHVAANPLARPLAEPLDGEATARLAAASLGALVGAWSDVDGNMPADERVVELSRLTLLAPLPEPAVLSGVANAAAQYFIRYAHDPRSAHDLVLQPTLTKLKAIGAEPTHALLTVACACADGLGETEAQDRALEMMARSDVKGADRATVLLYLARRNKRRGDIDAAERAFADAAAGFLDSQWEREWAIARGEISTILQARGELDEALRIRREEQLPVYERLGAMSEKANTQAQLAEILQMQGQLDEALHLLEGVLETFERLGDVRSTATTQGQIADLLHARGELDEALRIRTEEELPVYERLGDVRSKAITQGQIADILQARGELDGALSLLGEALGAFERLGDVRAKAATHGRIADILQARGQLDEPLRIRREEELPVYERLGDMREKAIAQGKIADILHVRGEWDEALRIRTEEQLPVYKQLGDARSTAITQGQIADLLQARGELDEALRIRREEELPVYQRLGDVRSKAIAQGKIAHILHVRGELNEALRLLGEVLGPFERLGDVRSKTVVLGKIAQILHAQGELNEALRICVEEVLPVYERLGNMREKAKTQGQIADILQARGEFDEALRIHREEELPVYERLGDVHERMITQGRIAYILQVQGKLDEALAIHEQRLRIAQQLHDTLSIAHIKYSTAQIRVQRGDHRTGGAQQICDDLTTALEIAVNVGHPDAIGSIGELLAQVLSIAGHKE